MILFSLIQFDFIGMTKMINIKRKKKYLKSLEMTFCTKNDIFIPIIAMYVRKKIIPCFNIIYNEWI